MFTGDGTEYRRYVNGIAIRKAEITLARRWMWTDTAVPLCEGLGRWRCRGASFCSFRLAVWQIAVGVRALVDLFLEPLRLDKYPALPFALLRSLGLAEWERTKGLRSEVRGEVSGER